MGRRRRDLNRLRRPLASRVVSYRLRMLGSAHSRFGSFASQKRYSIVFARSPLPDTRQGSNLSFGAKEKKRRRDLKQLCCPLVEIVVSVAYAWRAPDTPFLLPFRPRFIAHRARSDSIALAGYPARFKSLLRSQRKKETDRNGLSLFLAEKERFELSRRVYPTYTLSRGASSANLSTSPCSNQDFIPCGSQFFKSAPLL